MRAFVPSYSKWNLFTYRYSVWILKLSILDIFLLTFWASIWIMIWSNIYKSTWSLTISLILWLPPFLIAAVITFFEVSEMRLWEFIAKLIRNYFFDINKKIYVNYISYNYFDYLILLLKKQEWDKKIVKKTYDYDTIKEIADKFDKFI